MAVKTKKKNPQDATLRNINALKRRVSMLEAKMTLAASLIGSLTRVVFDNEGKK